MSSTLSKVDKAVATVKFLLKKKRKRVDELTRRTDLTENQRIFIGDELELIQNVEILVDQCSKNINIQLGKLPPQDTKLEESVLGAMILEESGAKVGVTVLETKHFYKEEHREIFAAIKRLWKSDAPIDLRTVAADLRKHGLLEKAGGATRLAELTAKVSSAANINYHAHVLIEMAIKRQLVVIGGKVMQEGYEDTTDALELLDFVKGEINEVNSWVK